MCTAACIVPTTENSLGTKVSEQKQIERKPSKNNNSGIKPSTLTRSKKNVYFTGASNNILLWNNVNGKSVLCRIPQSIEFLTKKELAIFDIALTVFDKKSVVHLFFSRNWIPTALCFLFNMLAPLISYSLYWCYAQITWTSVKTVSLAELLSVFSLARKTLRQ